MIKNSLLLLPSVRFILVIAFLIRLTVFLVAFWNTNDLNVFHAKDTATYLAPAQELLASGSFAVNGIPEVIRTPGYSIFLIIGILAQKTEIISITLQILFSVVSCYLIFLIGQILTSNENSARLGALLFCLEPLSITYTCYLLSETLFTLLLLLAIYQCIVFFKNLDYLSLVFSIIALTSAIYVRPIAYYLPIFWSLLLVLKGRKYFVSAAIFLLLTISFLSLWQVRNIHRADYAGFSAVSDVMLYFYHASSIEAQQKNLLLREVIENKGYYDVKTYYKIHPEQQNWTESQRYKFWRQEGLAAVREAPLEFTKIYDKGLGVTLLDPGSADIFRLFNLYPKSESISNRARANGLLKTISQNKALVFISAIFFIYLICIYFFSLAGFRVLFQLSNYSGKLLLLTCSYLFLLSGGVVAIGRLRAPIMPLLLIAAGHGVTVIFNKHSSSKLN